MTYAKPEVHEIGAAAVVIQGIGATNSDTGQGLPRSLNLTDLEE